MALPPEARAPKPKKRKKYTLPKTHKPEATTRRGSPKLGPPTPKYRAPAPKTQPGPYRKSERKKVTKFKKTPAYRGAIKQAYKSRPLAVRQKRVSEIANKLTGPRRISGRGRLAVEDLAVLDTYLRRARRDEQLMKSPVYTDRQRKLVEAHKGTKSYQDALLAARFPVTDKRYKELFEVDREKLKKAGFTGPGTLEKIISSPAAGFSAIAGALESGAAVAEGTYHDPIGVPKKTLKSLPLALAATPVAAANAVLHPAKTTKAFAESLTTPYDEKVKRVRKGGALEDIGNAAILAPSVGGAGRLLLRGATPRAAKLHSGALTRTPKTRGPVRYVVGSALDNRKAARLERLAAKGRPLSALQNEALQRNRAAGRTVAVVPKISAPKIRRQGVAVARGRGVAALRYARQKGPLAKLAKAKYRLNPAEKQALWAAMEGGIHTPAAARKHLPTLIAKMEASRTAEPQGRERRMDVIAELRELADAPEKHFTQNLRDVLAYIEKYTDAISDAEPQFKDITKQGRRRAVQQYLLDLEPGEGDAKPHISAHDFAVGNVPALKYAPETDVDFLARIDDVAAEAGLARPMYFKSEKQRGMQHDFAAAVVGGGKAKAVGKPFEGKNLGEGIFDTSFEQMLRGYEHNVKARHNYDLVTELNRRNRLDSIVPEARGVSVGEALNRINRAAPEVDPESFALVNPGIFRAEVPSEPGKGLDVPDDDLDMDAGLGKALDRAVIEDVTDVGNVDAEILRTSGWQVWPKEALRELEKELASSAAGGRAFDIVKGNLSKAILMTGNMPWLAIQFASENVVTAIASKGRSHTPRNVVGTVRWWKAMDDEQRGQVAGAMGLGATGADAQVVRMGSSIHKGFGHTWRGFKSADFWHAPRVAGQPIAHIVNPVKWMRAADTSKTNMTRLLYAHQELTKKLPKDKVPVLAEAMEGMADAGKAIDRLLPVLDKPAAEQLAYLKAHPEMLEDVADATSNALGDWTTLTAAERTWANRFIMFYPFVRYSTRLVLYTMPVDHPAVSALLAELGAMQAEEYREVFGDDDLPWNIGRIYFGDTGESQYIDLARANPLTNGPISALARLGTSSENLPGGVVGMLPPYGQWLINQASGVDMFRARPLRFGGDTNPFWNKPWEIGLDDRGKLLLADALSLFHPYREAESRLQPGSMSDESSLIFPVPMEYKKSSEIKGGGLGNDIRRTSARNAEKAQAFREEHDGGVLDAVLGPLVPKPSRDAEAARDRAYLDKLKAEQEKRRKQPGRAGGKPKGKSPFKSGRKKLFKSGGSSGLFKSGGR